MIEKKRSHPNERFIASLVELAPNPPHKEGDRAALAALRRGLGRQPGTVAELYRFTAPYFYVTERRDRENAMFNVASLFGLYPRHSASAGSPLRALRSLELDRGSIEKRVLALLNAGPEEISTHLRHVFHLLASSDRQPAVNYEQLLTDLTYWGHPNSRAQGNWARNWWADYRPTDDQAGTSGEDGNTTVEEE